MKIKVQAHNNSGVSVLCQIEENLKILILQISPNPCGDLREECKFLGDEYRLLTCKKISTSSVAKVLAKIFSWQTLWRWIYKFWCSGRSAPRNRYLNISETLACGHQTTSSPASYGIYCVFISAPRPGNAQKILSTSTVICHDKWVPTCYLPRWASSGVLLSSQFV